MKKTITLFLFIYCIVFGVQAQCTGYVNIPDNNFKSYLLENTLINTDGDTEISCAEATTFAGTINTGGRPISDLTGIEAFISITHLFCAFNDLESLDLSNNVALETLACYSNSITTLDLTNNTALRVLECYRNDLIILNISNNLNLEELQSHENDLTSLNISNNRVLKKLSCSSNNISSLNVSNNTELTSISCSLNNISSLDVSNNIELTSISCSDNNISSLDVSNNTKLTSIFCPVNNISSLDFSKNPDLNLIYCDSNELTSLNIANGNNKNMYATDFAARGNSNLTCIQVDADADLTQLAYGIDDTASFSTNCNPSECVDYVNIPDANFKATLIANTDINTNGDLEISCTEAQAVLVLDIIGPNSITDLSGIDSFINLENLGLLDFGLTSLDISNNIKLEYLFIQGTQLSSLNLSRNTELKELSLGYNPYITSLDLSKNTKLIELSCNDINITSLDLSKNTELTSISFNSSIITNLDLSKNTKLIELFCNDNNNLMSLNVSKNTELTTIYCWNSNLTSLDISNNTKLNYLDCWNSNLMSLDLSKNTELDHLDCRNNRLTSLDVSNNTKLSFLRCQSNELASLNIANGNNANITNVGFRAQDNPDLICIQVDDVAYSIENWKNKDEIASFSEDCDSFLNCFIDIPDDFFKRALLADPLINTDGDSEIRCDEATAFTGSINISYESISDLTGVEAFVNITGLDCDNNDLTSIDLSNNIALEQLSCSTNDLTNLDLSNNVALTTLFCGANSLISMDLSNNIALNRLSCAYNDLESLDLSNNIALETLDCYSNKLTSLDLSQNLILYSVECYDNQLTDLNIANGNNSNTILLALRNPDLKCIQADGSASNFRVIVKDDTTSVSEDCSCNVNIPDTIFKVALVSNTNINTDGDTEISCEEATSFTGTISVSGMGISNLTGIEAFINLTQLFCSYNSLTALDLSKNTALTNISCAGNQLTSLNVANGNNINIPSFNFIAFNNLNLECIQVDDVAYSSVNWFFKDSSASFSTGCNFSSKETSSIIDTELNSAISVYPNPVVNTLNIRLHTNEEIENLQVYNLLGEEIITSKKETIDVSSLTSGIYLLKVKSMNGKVIIRKIIKK